MKDDLKFDSFFAHKIRSDKTGFLNKESAVFKFFQDFFPKLSEAKAKVGAFDRLQVRKIIALRIL